MADVLSTGTGRQIPLCWLQALRGRSVLFTREEALAIIGPHWATVVPEEGS